jgi:DNA-binding XRE family transcriptional regulator
LAIRNRIKVILAERNMQQNDLAKKVGLSKSALSNIINSKQNPTLDTAFDIAEALKMPIDDIFYREDYEYEAVTDFIELIDETNKIYTLHEEDKLDKKSVTNIFKILTNSFIEKYELVTLYECFDAYSSGNYEKINPIMLGIIADALV